jgi:hypothetical protein
MDSGESESSTCSLAVECNFAEGSGLVEVNAYDKISKSPNWDCVLSKCFCIALLYNYSSADLIVSIKLCYAPILTINFDGSIELIGATAGS